MVLMTAVAAVQRTTLSAASWLASVLTHWPISRGHVEQMLALLNVMVLNVARVVLTSVFFYPMFI